MKRISSHSIFSSFINRLNNSRESVKIWNDEIKLSPWTKYASRLFVDVLHDDFGLQACCKGKRDTENRSEYLCLDVCGYYKDSWGPLVAAIEIENTYKRIQYSAWKLLCVNSRIRILLCYYDSKSVRPSTPHSENDIINAISAVLDQHPISKIDVIVADVSSDYNDWTTLFKCFPIKNNLGAKR